MKKYCYKFLIGIITIAIISSGVFFLPAKRADATGWPTFDAANWVENAWTAITEGKMWIKEFILDTIAWTAANMVIDQMTKETVNWINSGFKGNPLFVTNPGAFFKDIADQTSGVFFEEFGLTGICQPFKVRLELALRTANRPYQRRMQCTVSRVIENIEAFEQDFLAGGWAGWIAMTTQPQNNIYGAYLESADELARRQEEARNSGTMEVSWGQGFLSKKGDCLEFQKLPEGVQGPPQCLRYDIVTPGSTIQNRLNDALGADFGRLQVADEINEILGSLINQFISSALRNLRGGGSGGGGGGGGGGTPLTGDVKKGAIEIIDRSIADEQGYKDNKQNSSNTIDQIISKLKSCSATDPRIDGYESKKTGINNDIVRSGGLITDAGTYKTEISRATTYENLQKILDDFNNIMQPRMHSIDEIGSAAIEYATLQGELTQINEEYSQCTSSTP